MLRERTSLLILAASITLAACTTANQVAMEIGPASQVTTEARALQTRRFDTVSDETLLAACVQTLQDLGYTIQETAPSLGVVVATKQRDAEAAGQVAGQIALTLMFAVMGVYYHPTWDKEQTIRVAFSTNRIENSSQTEGRVIFDRLIRNNQGLQSGAEVLVDPKIYQEFFERLSSGVFLEAQKL